MSHHRHEGKRHRMVRPIERPTTKRAAPWHADRDRWLALGIGGCWWWAGICLSARRYMMVGYATLGAEPAALEPLLASTASWLLGGIVAVAWLVLRGTAQRRQPRAARRAMMVLAIAALPALLYLLRLAGLLSLPPSYWEVLWLVGWTGISFAMVVPDDVELDGWPRERAVLLPAGCALAASGWWYWQSTRYYEHFLLGYNDFGHFMQRVASTASGRGFLRESPVLPPFWDHFNPGLLMLVPLWRLWPSVYPIFMLQAVCLGGSALLLYWFAVRLRFPAWSSAILAVAWLVHPVVGQMNLAYTYGWHPISVALPLLWIALVLLAARHCWGALGAALLAMSMQEDVIVVVGCFSAVATWLAWREWKLSPRNGNDMPSSSEHGAASATAGTWMHHGPWTWGAVLVGCVLGFLLVYRYSGLAQFQTGRFVALGNSWWEIMLSPLRRPSAFWGELLEPAKIAFVLSLMIPCYLGSLARGWPVLLAAALPLGVLVVWDHAPAASIAFQYSTAILPILWMAALVGSGSGSSWRTAPGWQRQADATGSAHHRVGRSMAAACGALVSGCLLSLYVGQMPWSNDTLIDVRARTYGVGNDWSRGPQTPPGQWLSRVTARLRTSPSPTTALATGRAAAHLVGLEELETIGQYWQRRRQLAELPDRRGHPLRAYQWLIIDRDDHWHQTPEQIARLEQEALAEGFALVEQIDALALYARAEATGGEEIGAASREADAASGP
ncbi:MAG: hypothetical protein KatS3mg111_0369 [Pirellulaceae bacterium]|nr:MAG: hypothetical protein KatS3mg111_0369 [Pirellulaceae bacterium]